MAKRDWEQFHKPKDLAIALSIEANELMERYLWKKENELATVDISKVKEELADVFSFALLLLDKYDLDLGEIIKAKVHINAEKYPVDKAKGSRKERPIVKPLRQALKRGMKTEIISKKRSIGNFELKMLG